MVNQAPSSGYSAYGYDGFYYYTYVYVVLFGKTFAVSPDIIIGFLFLIKV